MTKIFLSCRRENMGFAEFIRKNLQQWGYQVWMDIYDIPKGAFCGQSHGSIIAQRQK